MTDKEKASRYDSLQLAFKCAMEKYRVQRDRAEKEYHDGRKGNMLMAFNKGQMTAYDFILQDLERWSQ